ncbi:hypothetical protein ABPG74_018013 [Tetrahymena malaccensis]
MQQNPRLNGCEIIRQIGQGAFANVYLGITTDREYVAIKQISSQRIDGQQNKYLEKEIEIIKHLIQQGSSEKYCRFLLKFKSLQQIQNNYYIISELCPFGELYMHMQNYYAQYTLEIKIEFLVEIIKGIEALHKMKITHRDLKTDNILITSDNEFYYLKIADFGISSLQKDQLQSKVGTVVYMAPEILSQANYDYKVDIWSFGIIAFEIMTNKLYFPYTSDIQTINQIRQHTKYQKGQIDNEKIENILDLCLRKDPKERPEASEIREKLMKIQENIYIKKKNGYINTNQQPQYIKIIFKKQKIQMNNLMQIKGRQKKKQTK